jgi:hypothetical protein
MSDTNTGETGQPAPQQTELILGKFKSQDDLVKSYQELEKRVSTPATPAKLDLASLSKEFADNGKLSDQSISQLESVGITKEFIEGFTNGQKAIGELTKFQSESIKGIAGDRFDEMQLWASKTLNQQELEAYNTAVNGGYEQAQLAVSKLFERYSNEVGQRPQQRLGSAGSNAGSGSQLKTIHDVSNLMKDPRYGTDPGYTQEVERLVAESGPLGV